MDRSTASGHGDALPIFLDVLEQEADDRRTGASIGCVSRPGCPRARPGKPSSTIGCPWPYGSNLTTWPRAALWNTASTCWPSDCPAPVRPTRCVPWGHRLVEAGHSVLFAPAYCLVQELLAAKRDLDLPRRLRKLDNFDFLLLDDLGYLPQDAEESEVLFILIAERYERRSLGITSNLVFSEWERIFANPMATAAAIDRVVHHSVILEFDVPSYRTDAAQQRGHAEEVNRQN